MDKRRCHFSIVISRTLRQAWAILAIMLFNVVRALIERSTGVHILDVLMISGGLLLLLAIIFLFNFLRWRKTYIYLDGEELIIDRKTINSSKATVRLSSIAAVNLTQGILERVFGTYRLRLDINSSATAGTTDFELVFRKPDALRMKALLTEDPAEVGSEAAAGEHSQQENMPVCAFSFAQVVRHCLLSIPVWSFLIVALVGAGVYFELKDVEGEGGALSLGSLFLMAVIVIPVLYQAISPFFRYYNFTVYRTADEKSLLISYGLITKRQFTLPLDKTNAIVLKQPFLARAFGLCYGELLNVGLGNTKENLSPVFCLLISRGEVERMIALIAPAYVTDSRHRRSPRAAFLPVLLTWEAWGLALFAIAWAVGYWQVGAALAVLFLPCAYCSYRTKELGLYEKKVSISSGVFEKRTITIDYSKLQGLSVSSGPVCRRFGLVKGSVTILASAESRTNNVGYFPKDEFQTLEKQMLYPYWRGL